MPRITQWRFKGGIQPGRGSIIVLVVLRISLVQRLALIPVILEGDPADASDYTMAFQGRNPAGTRQYYRFGRAPNFSGTAIGAYSSDFGDDPNLTPTVIEFWDDN